MRKYLCCFAMGLQSQTEYRASFVLSLVSTVFPVIIQYFLWTAIFDNAGGRGPNVVVYGYTYAQILLYTVLAGMVTKMVQTGFQRDISAEMKNGGLNIYLVRPVKYTLFQFMKFMGAKLFPLLLLLGAAGAFLAFFGGVMGLAIAPCSVALFFAALPCALTLNFFIFYCVALVGFWLIDVNRFFGTIGIVAVVVSGGVFPLDIFGERFFGFVSALPFLYTVQFPIQLLAGRLDGAEIWRGFAMLLGWSAALLALSEWMWRRGVRRFVGVGG